MPSSKKNMSIFTDRFKNEQIQPQTDWTKDFLYSISTTGGATAIKPYIGYDPNEIIERSSGQPRIKRSLEKKFKLIQSIPDILSVFDRKDIKCCLCHSVIAPDSQVWYYTIRYTAKHFHYFACFDSLSPNKPSTKCYRRE